MKRHLTPDEQFQLELIDREIRAARLESLLFCWVVIPFGLIAAGLACLSILR